LRGRTGIALAGRFGIDAIAEQFLSHSDDMWGRINDHAMPRIEAITAASPNA
jgi:hypothetical protein